MGISARLRLADTLEAAAVVIFRNDLRSIRHSSLLAQNRGHVLSLASAQRFII